MTNDVHTNNVDMHMMHWRMDIVCVVTPPCIRTMRLCSVAKGFIKMFITKCVVVQPFMDELFDLDAFRSCLRQSISYVIKRSKHSGKQ